MWDLSEPYIINVTFAGNQVAGFISGQKVVEVVEARDDEYTIGGISPVCVRWERGHQSI